MKRGSSDQGGEPELVTACEHEQGRFAGDPDEVRGGRIRALTDVHRLDGIWAEGREQRLVVPCPFAGSFARRRDDDDPGTRAPGQLDHHPKDVRVDRPPLIAADGDEEAWARFGHFNSRKGKLLAARSRTRGCQRVTIIAEAMPKPAPAIVCHAGSASNPAHVDGPTLACTRGLESIRDGLGALAGAVTATRSLEDDPRFNAGTGSNLRLDGETIQMDASCMTAGGEFGAVAAIERVKNPVEVAHLVLSTPHILLVGDGARTFARRRGFGDFDPTTQGARDRLEEVTAASVGLGEWTREDLERAWNFETPLREALGSDTVGSVTWDGEGFAGALSSGGTTTVLRGRVGDVPLPGCGVYVGEHGAVAATGDGEYIARALLAYRAYCELEGGRTPGQVVEWALDLLAVKVDVGLIVISRGGFAGGSRHGMAWHGQTMEAQS